VRVSEISQICQKKNRVGVAKEIATLTNWTKPHCFFSSAVVSRANKPHSPLNEIVPVFLTALLIVPKIRFSVIRSNASGEVPGYSKSIVSPAVKSKFCCVSVATVLPLN